MAFSSNYNKIGILGYARSGKAAARYYAGKGTKIVVFDDSDESLESAQREGFQIGSIADVGDLDLMITSPGIPLTYPKPHPLAAVAQKTGVPLLSDIELFAELAKDHHHQIIAVTGTNGKSTTSALIHHILVEAGMKAELGGNIGKAVFELDLEPDHRVFVLEVSSFQLDLCMNFMPDIGIWLNLSPDHIDRHGSLKEYIKAKAKLFQNFDERSIALIGSDEKAGLDLQAELNQKNIPVLSFSTAPGSDLRILPKALQSKEEGVISLEDFPALKGLHNSQNAAAAYLALKKLGLKRSSIESGFKSFGGLAHRMEHVGSLGHVSFVNDSKATNILAAAKSLEAYSSIYWIAGGHPKSGGFKELLSHLSAVRSGYLIGEASSLIEKDLGRDLSLYSCGDMKTALKRAYEDARSDEGRRQTILLAPACSSFDQFKNFEDRGDQFRSLVRDLIGDMKP